jgi:hypothetical protein
LRLPCLSSPAFCTPRSFLSTRFLTLSCHPFYFFYPGIYDTLKECACISKSAGGIGLSMHNIRATGSYIRGTNGTSNGIVPMLRVFNDTGAHAVSRSTTHCRKNGKASGRQLQQRSLPTHGPLPGWFARTCILCASG